jgi:hypothetical protein
MGATMPFGVHRGRPLAELPDDYFAWLLTIELREPLRGAVGQERARRARCARKAPQLPDPRVAEEIIGAGLRSLTRRHHPDAGGSHEAMLAVNAAAEWLRQTVRSVVA